MSLIERILNKFMKQKTDKHFPNGSKLTSPNIVRTCPSHFSKIRTQVQLSHWRVKHLPLPANKEKSSNLRRQVSLQTHNANYRETGPDGEGSCKELCKCRNVYICPQCGTEKVPVNRCKGSIIKSTNGKMQKLPLASPPVSDLMTDSGISIDKGVPPHCGATQCFQPDWIDTPSMWENSANFPLSLDPPPSPARMPIHAIRSDFSNNISCQEDLNVHPGGRTGFKNSTLTPVTRETNVDKKRVGKIRLRIQQSICELESMSDEANRESATTLVENRFCLDSIHAQMSILCEAREVINRQMQELCDIYLRLREHRNPLLCRRFSQSRQNCAAEVHDEPHFMEGVSNFGSLGKESLFEFDSTIDCVSL